MITKETLLKCQKDKFDLAEAVTYLNCSYMSPMLKTVETAGIEGIRRKSRPNLVRPIDFFTEVKVLRKEYAKLINTKEEERIVVIPSTSYGIANVANNLKMKKGEKIIVVSEQFPSNYYVWQKVAAEQGGEVQIIEPPKTLENRGKVWNERILEAIDERTRLVATGNVHWADGTLFDLKAIRAATNRVGAWLVVDGTQSVGAMPFDVEEIQPDALICSGYKWLLGPYSIGLAYYGEALDNGTPIEENWINRKNSEDFAGLVNYESAYQPKALRYQVGGASNFILVPMMLEALRMLNYWGVDSIQTYCKNLLKEALQELQENGFWVEEGGFRGEHLVGVRFPKGYDIEAFRERLVKHKVILSVRGDAVRIAPNVYNTLEDVKKMMSCFLV